MKFIVKPRQHAWHRERLWSEGEVVDIAHITEKDYEDAKKRKPSKDLVPWGVPFGTKEGEQLRAKILAKLRGEAADQSSYTEDARVRAEELERQMKIGVPASERG